MRTMFTEQYILTIDNKKKNTTEVLYRWRILV